MFSYLMRNRIIFVRSRINDEVSRWAVAERAPRAMVAT